MAERDTIPGDAPEVSESSGRENSSDENGHTAADSPDSTETLSPTSVIYFKEALNSTNLRFGKKAGSLSPTTLRQYDFRIERIDSKRRSKCSTMNNFLKRPGSDEAVSRKHLHL